MNIGKSLKFAMVEREINGRELAARMGVSQPYISGIANGHKSPNIRVLSQLASQLNYSVSEFIALGENNKTTA